MTAEEMFEKLGFRKTGESKYQKSYECKTPLNLEKLIFHIVGGRKPYILFETGKETFFITKNEVKAILKQFKELEKGSEE